MCKMLSCVYLYKAIECQCLRSTQGLLLSDLADLFHTTGHWPDWHARHNIEWAICAVLASFRVCRNGLPPDRG